MKKWMRMGSGIALTSLVAAFSLGFTPTAAAETLLKAATTMVYGTSADTYSFNAPSAGTVTAQVSSVPWPVPLTALSFSVTTATDVLPSLHPSAAQPAAFAMSDPQAETFQVGPGTYFAHVMATAGGSLDLGLYSIILTFTPSAVPLPAAGSLLLMGVVVLLALRRTMRGSRNESVMSAA